MSKAKLVLNFFEGAEIPTMGLNINDDEYPWTEWILLGKKTIETRNQPNEAGTTEYSLMSI